MGETEANTYQIVSVGICLWGLWSMQQVFLVGGLVVLTLSTYLVHVNRKKRS